MFPWAPKSPPTPSPLSSASGRLTRMAPLQLAASSGSANRGLRPEARGKREDAKAAFIPLAPFPAVSPRGRPCPPSDTPVSGPLPTALSLPPPQAQGGGGLPDCTHLENSPVSCLLDCSRPLCNSPFIKLSNWRVLPCHVLADKRGFVY